MHANGCNAAMTGLVIAGLKEESSIFKMTIDEESWFGNYFYAYHLHIWCFCIISIKDMLIA